MTTLLLGLGNPILGDDGVGWKIIDTIRQQLSKDSNVRIAPTDDGVGWKIIDTIRQQLSKDSNVRIAPTDDGVGWTDDGVGWTDDGVGWTDDGVGWKIIDTIRQQLSKDSNVRIAPTENGVGWKAIDAFEEQRPADSELELDCLSVGGLALMERLIGYERVILVDAVQSGGQPGTVHRWRLEEMSNPTNGHTASVHDTSLQTALELGKSLGANLPDEIILIGVEAQKVYDFSEEMSLPVAAAVPRAIEMILDTIQSEISNQNP